MYRKKIKTRCCARQAYTRIFVLIYLSICTYIFARVCACVCAFVLYALRHFTSVPTKFFLRAFLFLSAFFEAFIYLKEMRPAAATLQKFCTKKWLPSLLECLSLALKRSSLDFLWHSCIVVTKVFIYLMRAATMCTRYSHFSCIGNDYIYPAAIVKQSHISYIHMFRHQWMHHCWERLQCLDAAVNCMPRYQHRLRHAYL